MAYSLAGELLKLMCPSKLIAVLTVGALWIHVVVCCMCMLSDVRGNWRAFNPYVNLNCTILRDSFFYRAVNTLRLGYTDQSVNAVEGNNRCLF